MKTCLVVLMVVFLFCAGSAMAYQSTSIGGEINAIGPCPGAPNSHDGIPDGSGFEDEGGYKGDCSD